MTLSELLISGLALPLCLSICLEVVSVIPLTLCCIHFQSYANAWLSCLFHALISSLSLSLIRSTQECILDVKSWMTHNKLKLNDGKTEVLIISAPRISNTIPLPGSLIVGNSTVRFSQSAIYFEVTLDIHLTVIACSQHDPNCFELRRIKSSGHYLSVQATKTCFCFYSFTTGLLQFPPFWMPSVPSKETWKGSDQCSPPHVESS